MIPKIDDQGIHAALNSNAFYIGCLGSKELTQRDWVGLKMLGLVTNNSIEYMDLLVWTFQLKAQQKFQFQ